MRFKGSISRHRHRQHLVVPIRGRGGGNKDKTREHKAFSSAAPRNGDGQCCWRRLMLHCMVKFLCQTAHALLSTGLRCAAWVRDGQLSPRMDTVRCSCAMCNHASCADAGMLLLPHGTHQHLSRVCACLSGARAASGCLLHDVRRWRLRGLAAAVPVLLDGRGNACRGCGVLR